MNNADIRLKTPASLSIPEDEKECYLALQKVLEYLRESKIFPDIGWVYMMFDENNTTKIGRSNRPIGRWNELMHAAGEKMTLYAWPVPNASFLEQGLHEEYAEWRRAVGEWFNLTNDQRYAIADKLCDEALLGAYHIGWGPQRLFSRTTREVLQR